MARLVPSSKPAHFDPCVRMLRCKWKKWSGASNAGGSTMKAYRGKSRNLLLLQCLLVLLLVASPMILQAIPLNSISTSIDQQTQSVLFTLQFSAVPDFFAVDAFDRQQDSFQIYIL